MTVYSRHNEALAYNHMSLLDYFAAEIAAGLAAYSGTYGISNAPDDIANRSYEVAAAMIRRRAEIHDDIAGRAALEQGGK